MGIDYVTNRANQAPFVSYMAEDKLANDANGIVDILYRMLYNNSALAPEGRLVRPIYVRRAAVRLRQP